MSQAISFKNKLSIALNRLDLKTLHQEPIVHSLFQRVPVSKHWSREKLIASLLNIYQNSTSNTSVVQFITMWYPAPMEIDPPDVVSVWSHPPQTSNLSWSQTAVTPSVNWSQPSQEGMWTDVFPQQPVVKLFDNSIHF
jgi:hypothetical protein